LAVSVSHRQTFSRLFLSWPLVDCGMSWLRGKYNFGALTSQTENRNLVNWVAVMKCDCENENQSREVSLRDEVWLWIWKHVGWKCPCEGDMTCNRENENQFREESLRDVVWLFRWMRSRQGQFSVTNWKSSKIKFTMNMTSAEEAG